MLDFLKLYRFPEGDGGGGDGGDGDQGGGDGGDPAAKAAADKAAADKVAADAAAANDWRASLPPEFKDHPSLKNFKTPADLAKSHLEAQALIGKKGVILPTDKSTPEEWKAFYKATGAPEAADKYVLPEVKLPGDRQVDATLQNSFKEIGFKHGLSAKQMQGVYADYYAIIAGQIQQQEVASKESLTKAENGLKTEWGATYEQNKALVGKLVNQYGTPELKAELDRTGFGNNPHLIKFLQNVGSKFSESQLHGRNDNNFSFTPAEARKKMNEMLGDEKHPYNVSDHPEHKAAIDEYLALAQMAEVKQ